MTDIPNVQVSGPAWVRGGPADGQEWPVSGYIQYTADLDGRHEYRLQRKVEITPTIKDEVAGYVAFWYWEYWYERTDPWPNPSSPIRPSSLT